jgi:hypothetical protein
VNPFSLLIGALLVAGSVPLHAAAPFFPGELVRVIRGEMMLFQGKNFAGAAKGQELTLLKHDAGQKLVYVSFLKDDDTLIAVTLPDDAVEPSPPTAARDLLKAAEAFRDQRYDDAKRLLQRASADKDFSALASAISLRLNGVLTAAAHARSGAPAAREAFANALQAMRDAAEQLVKAGYPSLALPLDEGVDRLGGGTPPSRLDRAELTKRVTISQRCLLRVRQTAALRRMAAASKFLEEGLQAEPAQPELKAVQAKIRQDVDEAETLYKTATKMRRFEGGIVHALSAIDDGLKICADHAKLRELRKELSSAFEERTSPPITAAFLAAAKVSTPPKDLEEGRRLYTTRCTECHDLEMLESRSRSAWESIVGGMSRRAGLSPEERARVLDYIAAAQSAVEAGGSR